VLQDDILDVLVGPSDILDHPVGTPGSFARFLMSSSLSEAASVGQSSSRSRREPVLATPSVRPLALPLAFTFALIALSFIPSVRHHQVLRWSFWGAGAFLLAWNAAMLVLVRRRGRALVVEVSLRKQHYIQACAHFSILAYWGWYWHEVYAAAPLIAGQLVFAYAFDALLSWTRRDTFTFGFGPFPIIFSTNLFLWFKPDWFYFQFLLVAVGFAAKELIRWNKDGRRVHVFNPSSFPLAVASLALLLTGTTAITWGPEIAATQFNPPHIYLLIFLVALPGQFLFGVASMTLAAVATMYGFSLTYFLATGNHFFLELPFPIAIFLASHLLFTDPSTSPRTELGRLIFGVLYASGVIALYVLLERLGMPTFYDKLLPVPLLNVAIQGIDKAARSNLLKRFDPAALGRTLTPRRRHLAYMTIWIALFATMQWQTGTAATLARAESLKDQGRLPEAIVRYREFAESDPDHFEGQRRLGAALLEAGQLTEALPALQRAVALQPGNAAAHYSLGYDLLEMQKFDQAEKELEQAVALDPGYATAHYSLGLALWAGGKHDQAVETFREGVRRWPASAEAYFNLGAVLERNGQIDQAAAAYVKASTIDPSYADANLALGLIYAQRGEQAAAIDRFRRVLRVKPDSVPAETQLAWLLATSPNASSDDHRTALATAERLAATTSDQDASVLDVLAAALAANGQFDRAAETVERTLMLLGTAGDPGALAAARERLALYRSGKAYVVYAR
jgi:tetratricopeptide (TPR) repeat protein